MTTPKVTSQDETETEIESPITLTNAHVSIRNIVNADHLEQEAKWFDELEALYSTNLAKRVDKVVMSVGGTEAEYSAFHYPLSNSSQRSTTLSGREYSRNEYICLDWKGHTSHSLLIRYSERGAVTTYMVI